ncbi:MAG: hypothetical protein IJM14_09860 [Lachnospiraceae bacterium]|nr:hypothetical protein [Lachnospiraceae bacterium]
MAYKISAHKTLAKARTIFEGFSTSGVNALSDLARSNFVTSGSKHLLEQYKMIGKLCNQIEVDLTDAQRDSGFLAGKWNVPGSNKKTYNKTSINKKHTIDVDVDNVNITLDLMNSSRGKLDDVYNAVCKAYNEISGLETMNLEIGVLTVIEALTCLPPVSSSANILKKNILRNLNDVKRNLSKVSSFFGGSNYVSASCGSTNIIAATRTSLQKILACEEKVKRIPYQNTIDASQTVTSANSYEEIHGNYQNLENAQAQYEKMYGKKCPEIEEELARLRRLYDEKGITYEQHINFTPCDKDVSGDVYGVGKPYSALSQRNYPEFDLGGGSNDGCACVAYAIALNMLGETDVSPLDVRDGGSHACSWSKPGAGSDYRMRAQYPESLVESRECIIDIYEGLKNNQPTVLQLPHPHYVTIVGVDGAKSFDELTMDDFICIDPWDGQEKRCSEVFDYYGRCNYAMLMG